MENIYERCTLCPRMCGVDRTKTVGACGMPAQIYIGRVGLHPWEELCISYKSGAGTVFFSGCNLHCVYCQNQAISNELRGRAITTQELADAFLKLQEQGADCIDLVTPTHYVPDILQALDMVRNRQTIPVVYNTGGYEKVETIRMLDGYVDVYLPDIKYYESETALRYSHAADYFEKASAAVTEMVRQTGSPVYNGDGGMVRGTVIRHLVLPGHRKESMQILDWIREHFEPEQVRISLMSQYTPLPSLSEGFPELKRRITSFEYESVVDYAAQLGLEGYMQEKSSARETYIPEFYEGKAGTPSADETEP